MKKYLIILLCALAVMSVEAQAQDDIVLTGQKAPDFTLKTANPKIKLSDLKGKVVLINFFATWCGPCRQELPEVQTKIWNKYKNHPAFSLLIIAREQTMKEVNDFKVKNKFTMPFYADTDRSIYSLYAKQYIPRNYLIDKNGVVVYQSMGYTEEDFAKLLAALEKAIAE